MKNIYHYPALKEPPVCASALHSALKEPPVCASALHGGNIYAAKERYGKEVIDFSASINPLGLPKIVRKILSQAQDTILHYPDPAAKKITSAIAGHLNIGKENILIGNGSTELIYLIMQALRPKRTIIPVPTFSEYERAGRCVNSKVHFIKLKEKKGFILDRQSFREYDLIFLCNPNNPTGNLILPDPAGIKRLKTKIIVVDESFMDFVKDEKRYTFLRHAAHSRNIIVLRTFTKMFALPGLRIGYLVAHKNIISRLKQYQPPWTINSLAQLAAELVLNDKKYIESTHRFLTQEKEFLIKQLNKVAGLKIYPSVANFLLIKIDRTDINSGFLSRKLLRDGLLIRDCSNFRGLTNRFFRVAVRKKNENKKLIKALRKIFQ